MTKADLHALVAYAIGGESSNAGALAVQFVQAAVTNIGRMKGVDFNRVMATVSLTSGNATYNIGSNVFSGLDGFKSVDEVWRTDVPGWDIEVMGNDDFNEVARGGSASGPPQYATVYMENGQAIFEVYPIPDSTYTCKARVRLSVGTFEDISDDYHDVLYSVALSLVAAAKNPSVALTLARAGLADIRNDSFVGWHGSTIKSERHIGRPGERTRVDSGRLR